MILHNEARKLWIAALCCDAFLLQKENLQLFLTEGHRKICIQFSLRAASISKFIYSVMEIPSILALRCRNS